MLDDPERNALEQIKRYLDAGHSIDDIDDAGWGAWLDHFENRGIDVHTGKVGLKGPSSEPPSPRTAPAPQVKVSGNPFASGFFGCLGVGVAIIAVIVVLAFVGIAGGSCDTDSGAIILLLPH